MDHLKFYSFNPYIIINILHCMFIWQQIMNMTIIHNHLCFCFSHVMVLQLYYPPTTSRLWWILTMDYGIHDLLSIITNHKYLSDPIRLQLLKQYLTLRFMVCHIITLEKYSVFRHKHFILLCIIKHMTPGFLWISYKHIYLWSRFQLASLSSQGVCWIPLNENMAQTWFTTTQQLKWYLRNWIGRNQIQRVHGSFKYISPKWYNKWVAHNEPNHIYKCHVSPFNHTILMGCVGCYELWLYIML